jgi:hypothetical protein
VTPKQELIAHILGEEWHADAPPPSRATLNQLALWHAQAHRERHLAHAHKNHTLPGYEVSITLAPPKNPSASRNGDRNWTLHLAHLSEGHGWRYELAGTSLNFPDEAKAVAAKLLGWEPTWEPCGWGWRVKGGRGQ